MRKNQIKNRQMRKQLQQVKAPVSKLNKKINQTTHAIKINIIICIIAFLFSLLIFYRITYNTNYKLWSENEIIYQSHYYVPKSYSTRGFSSGGYYIIIDNKQEEWRVSGSYFKLNEMFKNKVYYGDKLKIHWHYWFFDRYVRVIESDSESFRSFDEAKEIAKRDIKPCLIILCFPLVILIVSVVFIIKNIRLKSKLKINLDYANVQLNSFIKQHRKN